MERSADISRLLEIHGANVVFKTYFKSGDSCIITNIVFILEMSVMEAITVLGHWQKKTTHDQIQIDKSIFCYIVYKYVKIKEITFNNNIVLFV